MRCAGATYREITEKLGVPKQTVWMWHTDPDGTRAAELKRSYAGECEVCGGPTSGCYGPGLAPAVCQSCITWKRPAIVDAMRRWADRNGGLPPTCDAWRQAGVDYPTSSAVTRRFNWNELLIEAGFELRSDRREETFADVLSRVRAGESAQSIADSYGCTTQNIYMRLRRRGFRFSEASP